ncbi:MAG: sialidase family protein [Candidatus Zixiibacteriota bacterium]
MTRKLWSLLLVAVLLVTLIAAAAEAVSRPELLNRYKLAPRAFIVQEPATATSSSMDKNAPAISLGGAQPSASPGSNVRVNNYMDLMTNGSLPRAITWEKDPYIHFAYTFLPTTDYNTGRVYGYNVFDASSGTWPQTAGTGCLIQGPGERGGFIAISVDPSDAAGIVSGHRRATDADPFRTHTYYDGFAASCFWGAGSAVPDAVSHIGGLPAGDQIIWPQVAYLVNGTDTVTFTFSCGDGANAYQLARKQGKKDAGTWTGMAVDTGDFISQTVMTSRTSKKVALAWVNKSPEGKIKNNSDDNDIYMMESTDAGLTWSPRYNVTNNPPNTAGHRPWLECAGLIDQNDKVRLVWNAWVFPADAYATGATVGRECRVLAWAQTSGGTGTISTVHNAEWAPGTCAGGINVMNVGRVQIGQCSNRFYVTFEQYNDRPAGVLNDCANLAGADAFWAANGDIYVSVSDSVTGTLWDRARDITNSRTPGCDSAGFNGVCDDDNYPSIAPYGMDEAAFGGLTWPVEATVDLDPSFTTNYYTHILFLNDKIAGSGIPTIDQGVLTPNTMKWVRFKCVPAVPNPILNVSPAQIVFPNYAKHGQAKTITVTMENSGNVTCNIPAGGIGKVQTLGPGTWLGISTTGGINIPAGVGNTATMDITLNVGGAINTPGTNVHLTGYVFLKSNSPDPLDSIVVPIDALVADTVVPLYRDTVSTACTRLVFTNGGNMGAEGKEKVNLDYFDFGDCDQLDSVLGNSKVYMYDGSPIIITKPTPSTYRASWAIFGDNYIDTTGFKPVADKVAPIFSRGKTITSKYQKYQTDQMVTVDSSLALEETVWAPLDGDSCNFMIQKWTLFPYKNATVSNITMGEAFDWDVPSDSGADNTAGFIDSLRLMYQQGGEYNQDKPGHECQDNDRRFAGIALLGMYTDAQFASEPCSNKRDLYGAYTALNSDFVFGNNGFVASELWANMQNPGYSAEPTKDDQHLAMTFKNNFSLAAGDTVVVYSVLITVRNGTTTDLIQSVQKAREWYRWNVRACPVLIESCCNGTTGNVDGDPGDLVDISDLSAMVDYLFFGGAISDCAEENDVDKSLSVDISDLQLLIDFLFFGASLPNC